MMTLVVGRKFRDEIFLISDTMISDRGSVRANIFPGQLKAIIIDPHVSIAYAGAFPRALEKIRDAKRLLGTSRDLDAVLQYLQASTSEVQGTPWEFEFLVASHIAEPRLHKIWNGRTSANADKLWIGNPTAAQMFSELEESTRLPSNDDGSFDPDKHRCRGAAHSMALAPAQYAAHGVGGAMIMLEASEQSHWYPNWAGTIWWDNIQLPGGLTDQQIADRQAGKTLYGYSTSSSKEEGIAVLGVYLDQPKLGFVYSPIECDEPIRFAATNLKQVSEEVKARGKRLKQSCR
jgi:hypothetical protein